MKCLNEQAMLKLAKTALGITINPKGSAFLPELYYYVVNSCK